MTKEATSRIQSSEGKQHDGGVPKERFASRAQSTPEKRDNQKNQSPGRQFGKEKTRALFCYNTLQQIWPFVEEIWNSDTRLSPPIISRLFLNKAT